MNELHDDDLILFFYGEAENPEEIRQLLAGSAEASARYEAIRSVLEAAGDALPVPPRSESYGAEVWTRLRAESPDVLRAGSILRFESSPPGQGVRIRSAGPSHHPEDPGDSGASGGAARGRQRRAGVVRALWAAAAILLLAVGFLAGRLWQPRPGGPEHAAAPLPADARERILVRTVAAHLERSERLLTEVTNTGVDGTADLAAERQWARDLLAANRLYRQSAERGGRPRLAFLLDELEPFLLELAHSSGDTGGDEIADLRSRLAEQALLFKVRVVSQRLAAKQIL